MTDILRFIFSIITLALSLAAYFLVIGALFARRVAKTQRVINQMMGRSFLVGFVNFLFFGVILIILFMITDGNANRVDSALRVVLLVPTLALAAMLTAVLSLGVTSMAQILGERIFPEATELRRRVLGAVILTVACSLPFVGWFLLLPYVGLIGFGAVILGFFQKGE